MTDEITALPAPVEEAPPARDFRAGTAALAGMSEPEYRARLQGLKQQLARIEEIHRTLMTADTDYGVIPGTNKPTLLKPGAERLCQFYQLAAEFRPHIDYPEDDTRQPIVVLTECRLHLGTLDGPVVNTGHGAANSWERRYRYRRGERTCPECGKTGTIIAGKREYGGGFLCFGKKGGCGAKWSDGHPDIVNQPLGDVENPDPYDLLNTLLKMSAKRAHVDAVLRATATSSLYTQDIEEWSSPPPSASGPPKQQEDEEESRPRTPRAVNNGVKEEQPTPAPPDAAAPEDGGHAVGGGAEHADRLLWCDECGQTITKGQSQTAIRAYGKPYCLECRRGKVVTTTIG